MPAPGALIAAKARKIAAERAHERAKEEALAAEARKSEEERERERKVAEGKSLLEVWREDPDRYARDRFGKTFPHGLTPDQRKLLLALAFGDKRYVAAKAAGKVGKALDVDTPIPTPFGWTTMGELRPGDLVYDECGRPCAVLGCSDVMLDRPCFEVEFTSGDKIVADAEHLWETWSTSDREKLRRNPKAARARVVTTDEIRRTLVARKDEYNHAVEVAGAVECAPKSLPIPPYVLGVWLGDGHSNSSYVTTADPEILDELRHEGYVSRKMPWGHCGKASTYSLSTADESLGRKLSKLGILHAKRVPAEYLRGSRDQRLALLQGLLDTDGTCNRKGQCQFDSTNQNLAESAYELACSLGLRPTITEGVAKLYGRPISRRWRVHFVAPFAVFRLARKRERQKLSVSADTRYRTIRAVRPVESRPVRCIRVDSPKSLFLAGRGFIPTHNTLSAALAVYWFAECHGYSRVNLMSATGQNLDEVLWLEVLRLWDESQESAHPLPCERPASDAKTGFDPFGCRVVGLTAAKVETLGGYSGKKTLWVVDEASSEKFDVLYDGVRHNTMSGEARLFVLGNPTRPVGVFHSLWRNSPEKHLWERFTMPAARKLDDGTVQALYAYQGTGLSDQRTVLELVDAHGVDSDFVKVRIFGEFAETGENGVVSMQWIEEATERYRRLCDPRTKQLDPQRAAPHLREQLHLGVDVAWTGADDSVIYPRRGLLVLAPVVLHGKNHVEVAAKVVETIDRLAGPGEVVKVKIDTVGTGGGVWSILQAKQVERDSLYDAQTRAHAKGGDEPVTARRLVAVSVNVGERPTSKPTDRSPGFARLRDQLWFAGAYFLRDGGILQPNARLEEDLLMPTYSSDAAMRYVVESKDDVKKRLKRSPDLADAFNLSVYEGGDSEGYGLPRASAAALPTRDEQPIGWPSSYGDGGSDREHRPLGI